MDSDLKTLASSVAGIGEAEAHAQGQLLALTCAVGALIRSHPAPESFATEFRRHWQLAGSQHSNDAFDPQTQAGIVEVLEVLEDACSVPLNVRPGR